MEGTTDGEVPGSERENNGPVALALRQFREILRECKDTHAAVFFRSIGSVCMCIHDDDLVGARPGSVAISVSVGVWGKFVLPAPQ